MKIGSIEYFCTCLSDELLNKDKTGQEHIVSVDNRGNCVYCKHSGIRREVNADDIDFNRRYNNSLEKIKFSYLEILMKDKFHKEKVN